MSFDIYGEHLQPGHCEVHPYVHHPYPCPCCMEDYDRHRLNKKQEDEYYRTMEDKYYAEMEGNEEYDSWFRS